MTSNSVPPSSMGIIHTRWVQWVGQDQSLSKSLDDSLSVSQQSARVNSLHINSSSLTDPLTIIFACLQLKDYLTARCVCRHWSEISSKNTSWTNLNLDRLCSDLMGYHSRLRYIRSNSHELQSFGRLLPTPSRGANLSGPHWSQVRYLTIDNLRCTAPPLVSHFQRQMWRDEFRKKQQTLVVNGIKAVVSAQKKQQLKKLEGIQLTFSYDEGMKPIEGKLIKELYFSLTKLPKLKVLISWTPVHPLVSELIHLKVLIMNEFLDPKSVSIAPLHQLEYLHLNQLHSQEICDTIRHLSSSYALRTLSVDFLTEGNVDQLCLNQVNQPTCGLQQFEFPDPSVRDYSSTIRKILVGLPRLTSLHGMRWICKQENLIVPVGSPGPSAIPDTLVSRLMALKSISIYCHTTQAPDTSFTDLRFCTSLTQLYWNCSIHGEHHHHRHPNQISMWPYLPNLKRLILHTNIDSRGLVCVELMDLSVLQQLTHLEITSTKKFAHYVWTAEVFEMLTKLPHFQSYTINHPPLDKSLEFSPRMLRAIVQSPSWLNITILTELPPYIQANSQSSSMSDSDPTVWIQSQPNLRTQLGSNIKWKHFRVKYVSSEYQLIPTRLIQLSTSVTPSMHQLDASKRDNQHPSAQNYTWLRSVDIDQIHSHLTYSTDLESDRCAIL